MCKGCEIEYIKSDTEIWKTSLSRLCFRCRKERLTSRRKENSKNYHRRYGINRKSYYSEWHLENRDRRLRSSRERYAENPKREGDRKKKYRDNNKEHVSRLEKDRYSKNVVKERLRSKDYALRNPDAAYERSLKYKYGVDEEWYRLTLESQNGVCAICYGGLVLGRRHFSVDHNHETGEVRGLLCEHCNRGVGCFRDNTGFMQEAIGYLREFSENSPIDCANEIARLM